MRKEWFAYVKKVRAQQTRKNKAPCSHREAMRVASTTWAKQKQKIIRKRNREAKKETLKSVQLAAEIRKSE